MKNRHLQIAFAAALLLASFAPAIAQGQTEDPGTAPTQAPMLTFRKIFKSSYPEFVEIKVNANGSGTWDIRQLDDTPNPRPLQLSEPLTHKMFDLAAQLHDFQGVNLDVHRRIADLGQKTFRYQNGPEIHEVSFNYTINGIADQLLAIFDGLQRQELDLSDLERTVRYDHLGVNEIINRIQDDVKNKLLPEPQALLPALDQVAGDTDLLDMARQSARAIAEEIRSSR
ncbi:MAG TPA: hypothetical protein VGR81_02970 [Candidatus Acidoferrales bacterium]|nr:hypothetical protein [Candidatus Acidoferrales bacterium]